MKISNKISNFSLYFTVWKSAGNNEDGSTFDSILDAFCRENHCYTVYFPKESRMTIATSEMHKHMITVDKKDPKLSDEIFIMLSGRLLSFIEKKLTDSPMVVDCITYIVYRDGSIEPGPSFYARDRWHYQDH